MAARSSAARVHPFPQTTDFSSFLVTAAAARPDVVGFCNAGTDMINCVKQAQEFGLAGRRIRPAAMIGFIIDVHTLGLPSAQGLTLTESFYWDLNERTRGLHERLRGKMANNHAVNSVQAQAYGCAFHYLRAVADLGAARAKASGLEAVQAMKRLPTDDDAHGAGSVRADGRKLHPTYLFQVKAPEESRGALGLLQADGDHAGGAGLPALGGGQLPVRQGLKSGNSRLVSLRAHQRLRNAKIGRCVRRQHVLIRNRHREREMELMCMPKQNRTARFRVDVRRRGAAPSRCRLHGPWTKRRTPSRSAARDAARRHGWHSARRAKRRVRSGRKASPAGTWPASSPSARRPARPARSW